MGDETFEKLLVDHGGYWSRLALLLTGDRGHGEDLLQDVLERAYRDWEKIRRLENASGYVHRSLINAATSRWRRLRVRVREVPFSASVDRPRPDDTATYDLHDALIRVLKTLPARQRAVLVLRYWHDMSEADIAANIGCSVGAVKSSASRGLDRLRQVSGDLQANYVKSANN